MKSQIIKLNLGSGPDGIGGWINYDWGWLPFLSQNRWLLRIAISMGFLGKSYWRNWSKIYLRDLRKGIPLEDDQASWIYSSHFLEHLEKYETAKLLKECFRVLKAGGKIRIVLPDIQKLIDGYLVKKEADVFCREFFGFNKDLIVNSYGIRGHQWMYDPKSISLILAESGFKNIKISKYRQSEMPDVDKLDLKIHQDLSLYVEAEKVSNVG